MEIADMKEIEDLREELSSADDTVSALTMPWNH